MKNIAKQNYVRGNRIFQDDPKKDTNIGNEGFPNLC